MPELSPSARRHLGLPGVTGLEGAAVFLDPVEFERGAVAQLDAIVGTIFGSDPGAADLVVGARGKGRLPGPRLGSVSSQVAHRAHRSVLIIRHES